MSTSKKWYLRSAEQLTAKAFKIRAMRNDVPPSCTCPQKTVSDCDGFCAFHQKDCPRCVGCSICNIEAKAMLYFRRAILLDPLFIPALIGMRYLIAECPSSWMCSYQLFREDKEEKILYSKNPIATMRYKCFCNYLKEPCPHCTFYHDDKYNECNCKALQKEFESMEATPEESCDQVIEDCTEPTLASLRKGPLSAHAFLSRPPNDEFSDQGCFWLRISEMNTLPHPFPLTVPLDLFKLRPIPTERMLLATVKAAPPPETLKAATFFSKHLDNYHSLHTLACFLFNYRSHFTKAKMIWSYLMKKGFKQAYNSIGIAYENGESVVHSKQTAFQFFHDALGFDMKKYLKSNSRELIQALDNYCSANFLAKEEYKEKLFKEVKNLLKSKSFPRINVFKRSQINASAFYNEKAAFLFKFSETPDVSKALGKVIDKVLSTLQQRDGILETGFTFETDEDLERTDGGKYYCLAAAIGDPISCFNASLCYAFERGGVLRDENKSTDYIIAAALLGMPEAQMSFAFKLHNGSDDDPRFLFWLRLSASPICHDILKEYRPLSTETIRQFAAECRENKHTVRIPEKIDFYGTDITKIFTTEDLQRDLLSVIATEPRRCLNTTLERRIWKILKDKKKEYILRKEELDPNSPYLRYDEYIEDCEKQQQRVFTFPGSQDDEVKRIIEYQQSASSTAHSNSDSVSSSASVFLPQAGQSTLFEDCYRSAKAHQEYEELLNSPSAPKEKLISALHTLDSSLTLLRSKSISHYDCETKNTLNSHSTAPSSCCSQEHSSLPFLIPSPILDGVKGWGTRVLKQEWEKEYAGIEKEAKRLRRELNEKLKAITIQESPEKEKAVFEDANSTNSISGLETIETKTVYDPTVNTNIDEKNDGIADKEKSSSSSAHKHKHKHKHKSKVSHTKKNPKEDECNDSRRDNEGQRTDSTVSNGTKGDALSSEKYQHECISLPLLQLPDFLRVQQKERADIIKFAQLFSGFSSYSRSCGSSRALFYLTVILGQESEFALLCNFFAIMCSSTFSFPHIVRYFASDEVQHKSPEHSLGWAFAGALLGVSSCLRHVAKYWFRKGQRQRAETILGIAKDDDDSKLLAKLSRPSPDPFVPFYAELRHKNTKSSLADCFKRCPALLNRVAAATTGSLRHTVAEMFSPLFVYYVSLNSLSLVVKALDERGSKLTFKTTIHRLKSEIRSKYKIPPKTVAKSVRLRSFAVLQDLDEDAAEELDIIFGFVQVERRDLVPKADKEGLKFLVTGTECKGPLWDESRSACRRCVCCGALRVAVDAITAPTACCVTVEIDVPTALTTATILHCAH